MKLLDDLARLRADFDGSFTLPPAIRSDDHEPLLGLRLDGDPWALRLGDISALVAGRKIVPLPSALPAVLGVASLRGEVVAVYSLAALLGYARPATPPRWLAVCRDAEPVGFAFSELDGYFEVPRHELLRPAGARAHLHALVRDPARPDRPTISVLDAASLVETMKRRAAEAGAYQER